MSDKNRNDLYDPPPYGFKWHVLECDLRPSKHERCSVRLFLPAQLANALVQQKAEAEDIRYQKLLDERAALDKKSSNSRLDTSSRLAPAGIKTTSSDAISMERLLPSVAPKKQPKIDLQLTHQVYSVESASAFLSKAKSLGGDKELRKRDEELGKQLVDAGPYRSIAQPGESNHKRASSPSHKNSKRSKPPLSTNNRLRALKVAFDGLRLSHPHFSEVVGFIGKHLVLASRSTKALGLPPILLNGEPGLGKTHFVMELAGVMGTVCRTVAFDTPVTAATLMGSDRRWGNTQYGLMFELICLGQYANPVIVLDEIDKAETQRGWNPLAPLHTLLEPSTASCVRDLSVDFEFDASRVSWIATANNSRLLSPAVRSRFAEFDIHRPEAAVAIASAKAVVAKSFAALQLVNFDPPDKAVVVALAHLTSREITQVLKQSVATAIEKGKCSVSPEDLPDQLRDESDLQTARSPGANPANKPKTWLH